MQAGHIQHQSLIHVERAMSELRRGLGVIVSDAEGHKQIVFAAETVKYSDFSAYLEESKKEPWLILSKKRIAYLCPELASSPPFKIKLDTARLAQLESLVAGYPVAYAFDQTPRVELSLLDYDALQLIKYAELLPAMIVFDVDHHLDGLHDMQVTTQMILDYQTYAVACLEEVTRASLVLANAEKAVIVAFRHTASGREHYAIIIGEPKKAPLVRVHSSCYTGDILSSLLCDCRDQLHMAISMMAAQGGGILLYMLQEGRGIGLVNKLRAYAIKEQGRDTVDANEILGFEDDERLFAPAVAMLKALGIDEVRLLTNNPRKAEGLTEGGIKVLETVSIISDPHQHNEDYLHTKATRLGHHLTPKEES